MPLPLSLIQQIENHSCFSGTYDRETDSCVCIDPNTPPESVLAASCRDCLTFRVGVLRSLLPPGMSATQLADELTRHLRTLRGYTLSVGGYHATGTGFWLSMAYYDHCGLFLLDGSRSTRSRPGTDDLDLLIQAFQNGVVRPPHPLMLDPQQYTTEVAYVNFTTPVPVQSKQDLLSSIACRRTAQVGYQRVTLAEFQPVSRRLLPPSSSISAQLPTPVAIAQSSPITPAPTRVAGQICATCGHEVKERPLFSGSYLGCMC